MGVLTLVVKLRPDQQSHGMTLIARELALEFGAAAYKPRVFQHIPGLANDWADLLSRLRQPNKLVRIPGEFHAARRDVPPPRDEAYYATRQPIADTAERGHRSLNSHFAQNFTLSEGNRNFISVERGQPLLL